MKGNKPGQGTTSIGLNASDKALFQQHMQDVRPIRVTARIALGGAPAAPPTQMAERRRRAACDTTPQQLAAMPEISDHFQAMTRQAGDSSYLRAGYGPDLLRGLRRGKWPVEACLDLHGATLDQARRNLDEFLSTCVEHRQKCVRIVHGKGYGSRNGKSVLKDTVRRWLSQLDCVCAYVECKERDGGTGAVQVLLRIAKQTGIQP